MNVSPPPSLRMRKPRRLSTPAPKGRFARVQSCSSLPKSVSALDLQASATAPAAVLSSVRALVLSHLADLEHRLSQLSKPEVHFPDSFKGTSMEDARAWAQEALDMLNRIRADVSSHLPDVPFDSASVEARLHAHLQDFSLPSMIEDLRSRLPDVSQLRSSISSLDVSDMQSKFKDVYAQLPSVPTDFPPLHYLPTLSEHLQSLYTHIHCSNPFSTSQCPSLPSTTSVSELLDKILSSDYVPEVLHRAGGHESKFEKAAREMSEALKLSLNGSRLVTYVDLPVEWRNNHFVSRGYR